MSIIKKTEQTALEAFEAQKAAIIALLVKIPEQIRQYDREISGAPGGHDDWSHAGTLKHVREQIEGGLGSITCARQKTREKARRRRLITQRSPIL